jgi:spore germination protein YaaH
MNAYLECETHDFDISIAVKAAVLADQVVEMKATLIEELESGIPEAVATTPASSKTTDTGSTSYQQMLAKAKAAKAANSA